MLQAKDSGLYSGQNLRLNVFYWLLIVGFYLLGIWNDRWLLAMPENMYEAWKKGFGHLMTTDANVALRFVALRGISVAAAFSLMVLWVLSLTDNRIRRKLVLWTVLLLIAGILAFVLLKLYEEQELSLRSREILLLWTGRLSGVLLAAGLDKLLRRTV